MSKRKKVLAVVGVLVAAQVFSGCYVLRELDWSKDKVDKGKTTNARIGLQGTNEQAGRFFLLTFFQAEEFTLKSAKFDTGKDLGNKPQKMVRDPLLTDAALASEDCQTLLPSPRAQGGPDPFQTFRTKGNVKESNKQVDMSLSAKASQNNAGGIALGVVFSGIWIDDGDDVPEPDQDTIACTGSSTTTVTKKGPIGPVRSGFDLSDLGG